MSIDKLTCERKCSMKITFSVFGSDEVIKKVIDCMRKDLLRLSITFKYKVERKNKEGKEGLLELTFQNNSQEVCLPYFMNNLHLVSKQPSQQILERICGNLFHSEFKSIST